MSYGMIIFNWNAINMYIIYTLSFSNIRAKEEKRQFKGPLLLKSHIFAIIFWDSPGLSLSENVVDKISIGMEKGTDQSTVLRNAT